MMSLISCLYLASVLEDNGATVIQATDSDEALELARKERPDLLTLDLAMPGRDVTEDLRSSSRRIPTSPI